MANINKPLKGKSDAIKFVAEDVPKPEPTKAKAKRKKSPFKLHKKFVNEIKNDEKNVNKEIFKGHFLIVLHYF